MEKTETLSTVGIQDTVQSTNKRQKYTTQHRKKKDEQNGPTKKTKKKNKKKTGVNSGADGKTITVSYNIPINWCKNLMNYYQPECRSLEGR